MSLVQPLLLVAVQGKSLVRDLLKIVPSALNWDYLLFCPFVLRQQNFTSHHFCVSHGQG